MLAWIGSEAVMGLERREVYFSGRVQGVGFRYTTVRISRRHRVTGFVENLGDGRVHLIAEGEKRELATFLDDIQTTMKHNIRDTQSLHSDYVGEFQDFDVRR